MTEVRSTAPAPARAGEAAGSPSLVVTQGAAMLAVGMGVGRFVYTPILPLMEHQAGLTATMASNLATANYLGYLGGALTGIFLPSLARSRLAARVSLLVVIATLALMPVTFEGIGYIIAGTFLVAAISQNSPGWLGGGAWVVVGIAATPASAMWAYLAHRRPRPTLLLVALIVQAVGIALPGLAGGIAPALISAVLFGNTFVAVSSLALAIGAHLQFPRSLALLTAGYSVGQILGPLAVKPLLHGGYRDALLVAAAIVVAGAVAAVALRVRFPHRVGAMIEPSRPVLDR